MAHDQGRKGLQHHYRELGDDVRLTGPAPSVDDDPSRAGRRLDLWDGKADPDGDRR